MAYRMPEVITVGWAMSVACGPDMGQQAVEGARKIVTAPAEVPIGTARGTGKAVRKTEAPAL